VEGAGGVMGPEQGGDQACWPRASRRRERPSTSQAAVCSVALASRSSSSGQLRLLLPCLLALRSQCSLGAPPLQLRPSVYGGACLYHLPGPAGWPGRDRHAIIFETNRAPLPPRPVRDMHEDIHDVVSVKIHGACKIHHMHV
jgi:hypothetical protein